MYYLTSLSILLLAGAIGCTEPMIDDSKGQDVTKTPDIIINVNNTNTNNINSTDTDNITFVDNSTLTATATATATACATATDNSTDNSTDNCTTSIFFDAYKNNF
jgi:hypothetical protein